ncbi:MAG: hypothetical protein ABL958_17925 [Bdellovibrionia bacterium]
MFFKSAIVLGISLLAGQAIAAPAETNINTLRPVNASSQETSDGFALARIEPHWLILKQLQTDIQFKVSEHFSVGPSFAFRKDGEGIYFGDSVLTSTAYDYKTTSQTFGVRAAYYLGGFSRSGLFISSVASFTRAQVSMHNKYSYSYSSRPSDQNAEITEQALTTNVGYQWKVGRFAFNAGGGVGYYNFPENITFKGGGSEDEQHLKDSKTGISIDAGVGYRF